MTVPARDLAPAPKGARPCASRFAPPALSAHLLLAADEAGRGEVAEGENGALAKSGLDIRIEKRDLPLPAERFNGAIGPLVSAAERARLIELIAGHGAQVNIHVAVRPGHRTTGAKVLTALREASALAARSHGSPLGLIWGPTGRLLSGLALKPLLNMQDPLALYLAPVVESQGADRHPALRLAGAKGRLGYALSVALGSRRDRRAAHAAALAFAHATVIDPSALTSGRFVHEGRVFRVDLSMKARRVALVPDQEDRSATFCSPAISEAANRLNATT